MKKLLNLILAITLSFTLVLSASAKVTFVAPETKPESKIEFTDVDKNSVSGQAIYKLVEAGILLGDGNGTFRPGDFLYGRTRGNSL